MDAPDMELYATEEIGDGLGHGIRIYRSDDTVYEARALPLSDARVYQHEGTWHAKIHLPAADLEGVYDRLSATVHAVNEAYDTALDTNPKAFGDTLARDGTVTLRDGATTLRYVEEEDMDEDEPVRVATASGPATLKGWLTGATASLAGGTGAGALAGGAFGMLAGPPGAAAGAAIGATYGAGAGGVWALWETFDTAMTHGSGFRSDAPITARAIHYFERRERTRYTPDAIETAEDHFDRVNTRRSLEQELEERDFFDQDLYDTLEELRDAGLDTAHETVMQEHFHRFEGQAGLTATHEADTYREAAAFIGHVTNNTAPTAEPSLYTSLDAFRQVFTYCTYTEHGETHYLHDAETLVHNVYDAEEADEAIVDWLENEHAELVQDVGRQHTMDG